MSIFVDPVQYHLFVGRPWPVGFRGLPFASDSVNPYCLETILFGVGKDLPSIAAPMGTKRAVEKGQVLNYPAIAYTSNPVLVCNASDALASVFGDLHCIWVCLKTRCPFYRKFTLNLRVLCIKKGTSFSGIPIYLIVLVGHPNLGTNNSDAVNKTFNHEPFSRK